MSAPFLLLTDEIMFLAINFCPDHDGAINEEGVRKKSSRGT